MLDFSMNGFARHVMHVNVPKGFECSLLQWNII